MKILFDTNVYVSEALVAGLAEAIIAATLQARWRVFASAYLLDELEHVLRDKLGFSTRMAVLARQRSTPALRGRQRASLTPRGSRRPEG